jgi:hypothetical protein
MQIPPTFKLFGQTWTIKTGTDKEIDGCLGMCYASSNDILIAPYQKYDAVMQTLLHEILHAIEEKMHLEMTERQIDCLSVGLIDLFRNNPELLVVFEPEPEE